MPLDEHMTNQVVQKKATKNRDGARNPKKTVTNED